MNLQEVYEELCNIVKRDENLSDEEKYMLMFGEPYRCVCDPWEKAKEKLKKGN